MTNLGGDPLYELGKLSKINEEKGSSFIAKNYLPKLFSSLNIDKKASVLDVGCGIGKMVETLREIGYDAYGLEPGGRYNEIDQEMRKFICNCYADDYLKISNKKYNVVMSFGVIEHVGTTDGHDSLSPDFLDYRYRFIEDQIKLLKPGGFLLVHGPNRLFPFDFQHGSHSYGFLPILKKKLSFVKLLQKLTIPWHRKNYLVSWNDIFKICKRINSKTNPSVSFSYFCPKQDNLLGLSSFERRNNLKTIFRIYTKFVDSMPTNIRKALYTHTLFVLQIPR